MMRALLLVPMAAWMVAASCTQPPPAPPPAPTPTCTLGAECTVGSRAVCDPSWGASELTLVEARRQAAWTEQRRHLRMMEAVQPGYTLRTVHQATRIDAVARGEVCPDAMFEAGRLLFEHEFSRVDGFGNGDVVNTRASPFHRVHRGARGGPDTVSCASCHWRGGVAGAGSLLDNGLIHGDGDTPASADARNPPALLGAGVAQLVAQEMTRDLHAARDAAINSARQSGRDATVALYGRGVSFGALVAHADGSVDTSQVEGVDADLVVKPFGWKGNFVDLPVFLSESLHVHMGIQSDALLARHGADPAYVGPGPRDDPDEDGVTGELAAGPLMSLAMFLALQEVPVVKPHEALARLDPAAPGIARPTRYVYQDEWARGREVFQSIGCATCHVPAIVVDSPVLKLRDPATGTVLSVDLSQQGEHPRLAYDPVMGGYTAWVFSDFKRHDMGDANAAINPVDGVPANDYQTRRLWGLAHSPPWFYDGRAPSLDMAISAHGGDAQQARQAFEALSYDAKSDLRVYLTSLRRERRPLVP